VPSATGVFSPNGKQVLSIGWNDGSVRLWDLATGHQVRTWAHPAQTLWQVGFGPEPGQFVSVGNDSIRVWSLETGKEITRVPVTLGASTAPIAEEAQAARLIDPAAQHGRRWSGTCGPCATLHHLLWSADATSPKTLHG
jgi:WD40 repeat protein